MVTGSAPLSEDEATTAARVAEADETVKGLVPGRTRVVATHALPTDRRRLGGRRHAVVSLHDYTSGRAVVAVVDLQAQTVVGAEETPARFQLHPEEQRDAERLAGEDPRVQAFLAGREMNPLTRLYFPGARPPLPAPLVGVPTDSVFHVALLPRQLAEASDYVRFAPPL
jgi:hypothetical protein